MAVRWILLARLSKNPLLQHVAHMQQLRSICRLVILALSLGSLVAASWSPTGTLLEPRDGFQLVVLASGKVLEIGGTSAGAIRSGCEIYDPSLGTWSSTGSLAYARTQCTATL